MNVHHVAFRTRDVERCARFYRDVVGLAERARHRTDDGSLRAIWLAAGETVVMIERATEDEPAVPPGSLELLAFAVTSDERVRLRDEFARRGVPLDGETANTIYLRDPDGRRIGLSSYDFDAASR